MKQPPSASLADASRVDEAAEELGHHLPEGRATAVGVLVWAYQTGRQLEAWLASALEPFDLDTSEYGVLAALGFGGAGARQLSAGALSERLVQTTGGTTKTIQRLADRGLVRRTADPDDGRRSLIALTPAGEQLGADVLEAIVHLVDTDLAGLDEAERGDLLVHLRSLSIQLGERLRDRR